MNQAVEDLNKDLVKVRQSYAEIMATTKRMEKQKVAAEKLVDEWLNRAQLALQADDEELAREALARKAQSVEQVESLNIQLETQTTSLNQLAESMTMLENKISEAKAVREQYIARARTAQTSAKVNDMLSGLGDGEDSMKAFDRMKEKVESLEVQAEVSASLPGSAAEVSLESKFKALEGATDLDKELAAMKANILPGSTTETPKLTGEVGASSEVEDELAKMKREMGEGG